MNFYLVLYHYIEEPYNGWALVYATSKRAARDLFKQSSTYRYVAIDIAASHEDPDYKDMFEDVKPEDYELARAGQVVTIEEGT